MENNQIVVPTLNIDELIKPVLIELRELINYAERVNIYNPLNAYFHLKKVRAKQLLLSKQYDAILSDCYKKIAEPVQGSGTIMSFMQTWSLSKGISTAIQLQSSWQELSLLIESKKTFTVAILSLYIAVLSIIITTVFGILSTPASLTNK